MKLKSDLILKDGTVLPTGTKIDSLKFDPISPRLAYITIEDRCVRVLSIKLWRFIPEFIKIADDRIIRETRRSVIHGYCLSLAGEKTEPDGWDQNGYPSVLLAAGIL